jgi:ferredoxin
MTTKMMRKIVRIDEEKCDGCGICVPACVEGALQIVDGKARLISEKYCDGLGACLGECPQGAITIEERAAQEFDEEATKGHMYSRASLRLPFSYCHSV